MYVKIFKSWYELLENYNLKKADIIFLSNDLREKSIHRIQNTLNSFGCVKIILKITNQNIYDSKDTYIINSGEVSSKLFKYFLDEIIKRKLEENQSLNSQICYNNLPGYFVQLNQENKVINSSKNLKQIWPDLTEKNLKNYFVNSYDYLDFLDGKDSIYLLKSEIKKEFFAFTNSFIFKDNKYGKLRNIIFIPVKNEELTLDLLNENIERLRIFNKVTNESILISKKDRIIDANESFFKTFKFKHADLEEIKFSKICKLSFDDVFSNLSNDKNATMETEFYRQDNSQFCGEISLKETTLNSEKVTILIIRDLTKWKEYEKILMDEKNKAEKANIAKSDFLAKMSHELRTPMNAIIGFSELLIAGIDGELNENQLVSLNRVSTAAHSLLDLINDILDLSKIEAGQMKFSYENTDIVAVAKNVVETLLPLVKKKNINLVLKFPEKINLVMDLSKIRQAFLNVLGNAIKFTDKGNIFFTIKDLDSEVLVKIKDDGIGIPKDSLEDIFNEFKQVQNNRLNNYQGTGLGLSITKKIIEAHKGKIWAESENNDGSTFFFILPKKREILEKFVDRTKIGKAKIFVVDDDNVMTDILDKFLRYNNYTVISTNNSTEAFRIILKEKPDLIIMDLMMPNLDGYQLSRILKNNKETKYIPIIIMSFFANSEMIKELGVEAYIPKPFTKDALFNKISYLLEDKNGK
jgi:signal transduction histidine kinase/CheY-like chemotaxis protein